MSFPFVAIILFISLSYSNAEWISHSENTMPRRENTMSAIGSRENTIFVLGGLDKKQQKTNYDIKSDSFVLYQSGFIPNTAKVFGEAQYWTQIGFNLYILNDLDPQNNKISVYNMADNSFISNFDSIPVLKSDGMGRACIASSDVSNEIFINGGITATGVLIKETNILNIENMSWHLAPQMQTARRSHSCIIFEDVLYSIGGSSTDSLLLTTIEKISIIDVHNNTWAYLNGSLSASLKGLRSFIYGKDIHIIGGVDQSRKLSDTIHIIDTTTDIVTLSDDKLAFPIAYTAAIMVNNIMYAFGGGNGDGGWQSQTISVPNTTIAPNTTSVTTKTPNTTSVSIIAPNTTSAITIAPNATWLTTIAPTPPYVPTVIPETTFPKFPDFTTTELEEETGGLSTGNKVGIGFAVALFICLLVMVGFCFFRDIKQKRNNKELYDDYEQNEHNKNANGTVQLMSHEKVHDALIIEDKHNQ